MVGKLPDVIPFSARTTLPRAIREYLRVTARSTTATEEAFQQQNNACFLSQITAILLESCPNTTKWGIPTILRHIFIPSNVQSDSGGEARRSGDDEAGHGCHFADHHFIPGESAFGA